MPDNDVQISHDAFARYSVYRRVERSNQCAWCERPGRFQYTEHADDNPCSRYYDNKVFCGIDCWRTYHGR